ncbi:MAG: preprotein translocase subunit SecA [Clostridia bacterium]|nr:preprotein translocase subunit SecA [Clostridia bacterium]
MGLIQFIQNFDNNRNVKKLKKIADVVVGKKEQYEAYDDATLKAQTEVLKERLKNGETLDDILPDAYALVSETAWRVLKQRPYYTQILGGIVLHQGRIAEMKTGEGKTLVATLPSFLNALTGKPVHVVTVNEYLAKYHSDWMGKIHEFLGLSVGYIYSGQDLEDKKKAYACDIIYGTNSEFGFDFLRDNMVVRKEDRMTRGLHFAIVDEVDSILIDEARTPLIISGPSGDKSEVYITACRFAKTLKDEDVEIDEKKKTIHLTESGITKAERFYRIDSLSDIDNTQINHDINNAIRARFMMKRDNDYIVRNGEVLIVDEFTGRIMVGRRYSDGLHQAIEAKENVKVNAENKTIATITLQNFFKMYKKLSGMTGTAKTEESEFKSIYGLDVVVIPTNKPVIRQDKNDKFYFSHEAKIKGIIQEIKESYDKGQPVLVGTITVEKSEELSKALRHAGIPHNVLNAKNHAKEAEIIAQAGRLGAVTIATNMAGRGTDILLGGNADFMAKDELRKAGYSEDVISKATAYSIEDDEEVKKAHALYVETLNKIAPEIKENREKVIALGGLKIVGTERHESRRIDNQLRGRAGRQGEPGMSVFYLSADDDLSRVFGSERLKAMASMLKLDDDTSINWKFFSRGVENAQKKVEGYNFTTRKNVVEFDNVLNKQREEVYALRDRILEGENMHQRICEMIEEVVGGIVAEYASVRDVDDIDIEAFNAKLEERLLEPGTNFVDEHMIKSLSKQELQRTIANKVRERYEAKIKEDEKLGVKFDDVERTIMLRILDRKWVDHIDDMDNLRIGIGLRGYANQNPVTVYQQEGFDMFDEMGDNMRKEIVEALLNVKIQIAGNRAVAPERKKLQEYSQTATKKNASGEIGRNSPCPCGSGKKYKNCCGK